MVAHEIFFKLSSVKKCLIRASFNSWQACRNTEFVSARYYSKASKESLPFTTRNVESRRALLNVDNISSGLRNNSTFISGRKRTKLLWLLGSGSLCYATWDYFYKAPEIERERLRKLLIQKMGSVKLLYTPQKKSGPQVEETTSITKKAEVSGFFNKTELEKILSKNQVDNIHLTPEKMESCPFKNAESTGQEKTDIYNAKGDAVNVIEKDGIDQGKENKVNRSFKSDQEDAAKVIEKEIDQGKDNKIGITREDVMKAVEQNGIDKEDEVNVVEHAGIDQGKDRKVKSSSVSGNAKGDALRVAMKDGIDQEKDRKVKTKKSKKTKTAPQAKEQNEVVEMNEDGNDKNIKDLFLKHDNDVDQVKVGEISDLPDTLNVADSITNSAHKTAQFPNYGGDGIKRKLLQSSQKNSVVNSHPVISSATEVVRGYRRISPSPISKRQKSEHKSNAFLSGRKNKEF